MKKVSLIMAIIFCSACLSGCLSFWVFPGETEVMQNEEFTVEVGLDRCLGPFEVMGKKVEYCSDASDVYGAAFDLNYDPSVLELVDVDVSSGVLSGATSRIGFRNSDTENGKLVVGVSQEGQTSGQQGAGVLAVVTFRAKQSGTTDLVLKDPHLVDSNGEFYVGWPTYQAGLHHGFVTVAQ